ncbi:transposable element Tcb2 transposase [Trichonephila clavipes]|nr:transposable element Tcb2 transposase [Trichonephila clavipes]
MSQRSHLTSSEAWRVVGRLEGGQTQAEVAQAIGVSQSVISRIWNRFLETGSAGCRPGQGRRRATTPNEDPLFSVNCSETPKYERYSSPTTPSLGYWHHGFNSDCPKPAPCCSRECATEHVNWRRNEWSNVLLSDEFRFSVHPDNRRIFIWRDRGSRNNPVFVHESVRFGGGGVLVYGGISIDGRTYLYIIRDGPLTAHRYRDEILRSTVVPYAAAIGDDFILMDDNCRGHIVLTWWMISFSRKESYEWNGQRVLQT